MAELDGGQWPFFYGLQPSWTRPDRFYCIFVAEDGFYGAWVAGQLYNAEVATYWSEEVGLVAPYYARLALETRGKRERRYQAMNVRSPDFLRADPRNFRLTVGQIAHVALYRQPSRWTAPFQNSGRLEFYLRQGGRWRFILLERAFVSVRTLVERIVPPERIVMVDESTPAQQQAAAS